jgi:Lamin Tail Domain/Secretion system C-terminal sorting domain/CotH kinase protein/Fn3 associated
MKKIFPFLAFVMAFAATSHNLAAQKIFTKRVASSNDDIEVYNNNTGNITSTSLQLHGKDGTLLQESFIRFTGVSLPSDAIINSVKLVFYAKTNGTGVSTGLEISGEIGNASAYPTTINTTTIGQLKGRAYTVPTTWTQSSTTASQKYSTPELKAMVQAMLSGGLNNANLSFRIKGNQQGDFTAWPFDGNSTLAPTLEINYSSQIINTTYAVTATTDDIEEYGTSNVISTLNSTLRIGGYVSGSLTPANKIRQGIRFNGIAIPPTAEIEDAYIEFGVYQTSTNTGATITIKAEKGNPTAYGTANNELSKRKYTSLSSGWIPERFATNGQKIRTVNLKNLIDENRLSGWQSGQSLAFLLDGNKYIGDVFSRNGSATHQPKLVIRTIENGKGPSLTNVITDPQLMTQIYINEVASKGTAAEKEDWIELYNANNQAVWIKEGVYISNTNSDPTKHELKNIVIPAKGRVILVADNTNIENNRVNFKLANENSRLYLSKKVNGVVSLMDEMNYTPMEVGQSFGRKTDGAAVFVLFSKDSYDAPNATGIVNVPVNLSHTRGVYDASFGLSIALPPNTAVRYTLDGLSTPSKTAGTVYNGKPISINKTLAIKIFAYSTTENANSGVLTHSFILKNNFGNEMFDGRPNQYGSHWFFKSNTNATEYSQAVSQIPIVSVTTHQEPTSTYQYATFEYIDKHVNANNSNYYSSTGVKKFGQESITFINPNLKFKFNSDYNTSKAEYPFFDILPYDEYPAKNKISRLELKEGQDGPSRDVYALGYARLSEKFMMNLQKQMGKYALNTKFVHLFINGKWRGVKTMRDDFAQQNVEEYFGDDDANYTKVNLQDENFTTGIVEAGEGSATVWNNARNLAKPNTFQAFKEKVDVDDYIKFMVQFMMFDMEEEAIAIGHNAAPLYSKFRFMINDTDGALYNKTENGFTRTYVRRWNTPSIGIKGPGSMFTALTGTTGNLEFKTLVKDAVLKHIGPAKAPWSGTPGAALSVSNMTAKVHSLVAELDVLYKVDAAYMGFANNVYDLWKNSLYPRIIAETPTRVKYNLEKWLENGLAHTLEPVTINTNQEINATSIIGFTNPNTASEVYYTRDGSDPMGADGTVSPKAVKYTTAFSLPLGNYTLVTRAFVANNWGPVSYKAVQVVPPAVGKFVITGINYKPQTNSDAEFLLITNAGNATLDLAGYKISDAITYEFPAGTMLEQGKTIMLAKNLSLITGFGNLVKYQWTSGSLNNSGEPITFKDPTGFVVDNVSYSPTAPWPTQANGLGYYLKLKDHNTDNALPANWEATLIDSPLPTASRINVDTQITTNSSAKLSVGGANLKSEEAEKITIKVYPNPVTNELSLNLGNKTNAQVLIYDLNGVLVIANDVKETNPKLFVAYLNAGVYIIKIILEDGKVYSQKIIKQ